MYSQQAGMLLLTRAVHQAVRRSHGDDALPAVLPTEMHTEERQSSVIEIAEYIIIKQLPN